MSEKSHNWRLLIRYWLMLHDYKSCDIYKKFKWYKQTSTTPELQPHYSMRSLSVDKLNIVRATYAGTDLGNCWKAKQRDTTQPCLLPRPDSGTLTPSLPTDATRHW